MATVTYTFDHRCNGGAGEHVTFGVQINVGASAPYTWTIEELREPLSSLTDQERAIVLNTLLRIHFAGQTRAQVIAAFAAGPVTVTI